MLDLFLSLSLYCAAAPSQCSRIEVDVNTTNWYICGTKVNPKIKNHFILYDTDRDSGKYINVYYSCKNA